MRLEEERKQKKKGRLAGGTARDPSCQEETAKERNRTIGTSRKKKKTSPTARKNIKGLCNVRSRGVLEWAFFLGQAGMWCR